MNVLDTSALLMGSAAIFSYVNHRIFRLPASIALTLSGLFASAAVIGVGHFFPSHDVSGIVRGTVASIDFSKILMHGALGFLLFAGSMELNFNELLEHKTPVLALATAGTLLSTVLMGVTSFFVFRALGLSIGIAHCFVFGALISPTDPVAVLGILKSLHVSKNLEVQVAGESLFNDGVGVVLFSIALAAATPGSGQASLVHVAHVFLQEVLGGFLLGFLCGFLVYRAMKTLEEPNLEVFLSLALVLVIDFAAVHLGVSAPLACVVAGLFIGNHGRRFAMGEPTRAALGSVWSVIDYALNAALFLLLGLEVVALPFRMSDAGGALILAGALLLARLVSVSIPLTIMRRRLNFQRGTIRIMTWGGLRGAISLALALSLPAFEGRNAILISTYGIVLFSVLVQGLTIRPLIEHLAAPTR